MYRVQKVLLLPLFILTYGISNSKSFISKGHRTNTVVWMVRLQPVRKMMEALWSPGVPCSSQGSRLRGPPKTRSRDRHKRITAWALVFPAVLFQKIPSARVCKLGRNTRLYSPFSFHSYVSIQESPQQLDGLVGLWAAPRGLSVVRLHRQHET